MPVPRGTLNVCVKEVAGGVSYALYIRDWLLVIKHGSSVQHLKLDVDGRADKDAAIVKAETYLAACGVTVAA